ncbi:MAG: acylphosphatase [Candidatus Eremiobacteraeota bacterium]|nr:acylphosphatase [Candidatus Eremiobacteraeota bacterium]
MRERRNVRIRGGVQGVFFRATVRRIASRYDVHGFVRNVGTDVVEIEAEGAAEVVNAFIADVLAHPPPGARIDDLRSEAVAVLRETGFCVKADLRMRAGE